MKKSFLKTLALIIAITSWLGFSSSSVLADDLKVALAAEPTSMAVSYTHLTLPTILLV